MRFLLDMNLSAVLAHELRAAGHDAVHLRERRLQRSPDQDVFALAASESRILLTSDLDFGEIAARSGPPWTSVVLFRGLDMRPARLLPRLLDVLAADAPALAAGAVVIVEPNRRRIRRLPIRRGGGS